MAIIKKETHNGHAAYVKTGGANVTYTHTVEDAMQYKARGAKIQATKLTIATGVKHEVVE
jgi:hypothetical protein